MTFSLPSRFLVAMLAWVVTSTLPLAADDNANAPLPAPHGDPVLVITGNISRSNQPDGSAAIDRAMLSTLPESTIQTSTSVTDGRRIFVGNLMSDLLKLVDAHGETVHALAHNDYQIEIPMSDFNKYGVILAHSMDGVELGSRDKGPLWLVYPRDDHAELQDIRYDFRWIWQLKQIEVK